MPLRCWCGNADLLPFSPDYARCPVCETLVLSTRSAVPIGEVRDDEQDFYGRRYWFDHQERDLGLLNIYTRARQDLPERCVYWLRTLLTYKLPPGRSLELGSSHGGFVALLRAAGFHASGLELSPWIADFARHTFDIPMYAGSVEAQSIDPASLDIIAAMDVLEHLEDPVATITHCVTRLQPNGLLLLQTPRYPEGMTYEAMVDTRSPFLEQLKVPEHIFLFSQRSIRELLRRCGVDHVNFEPAIFARYDMFVAASPQPLQLTDPAAAEERLASRASARLVQALIDLHGERTALHRELIAADADRTDRLHQVQRLHGVLAEANHDRAARLANIMELARHLEEANADRAARLRNLEAMERVIDDANRHRGQLQQQVEELQGRLAEIGAERAARQARSQENERLLEHLGIRWKVMHEAVQAMRTSPIYRALVRIGRWAPLDTRLREALAESPPGAEVPFAVEPEEVVALDATDGPPLVAIDVTPILPGGDNGGAKQLVLALLEGFAERGRHRYLLLTSERNHQDFARFDGPVMRRLVIGRSAAADGGLSARLHRLARRGLVIAGGKGPLAAAGVSLVFCPMTDPVHAEPGIPTVSIVYDLQHVAYPSFFTAAEREHRRRFFDRVKQTADAIVCISEFSRAALIEHVGVEPDRVRAIPIAVHHRLPDLSAEQIAAVRQQYGLGDHPFALFPANFWPHKNHRVLLVALARFFRERPDVPLRIVLVGSLLDQADVIRETIARLGLSERVHALGYVPEADLAALWNASFCLLFPSLYEGFGIPVLEAMRYGKPVICSGVASLPEVGGEAVRYVDPRKPATIVEALRDLLERPGYADSLVAAGYDRVAEFDPAQMIERYLETIDDTLRRGGQTQTARVDGVFGDGWVGSVLLATTGPSTEPRRWELEVSMPDWHPHRASTMWLDLNGKTIKEMQLQRGHTQAIRVALPPSRTQVRVRVEPSFVPDVNGDTRELTVMLRQGRLVARDSGRVLYEV